ncbi:hypothetical protein [Natronorubrum halalkaliphilum]|uniref:hypothetical protein n=1 Tax=Natronorubrum halalkaliphilum TaxID=2691917 RepID=UPI0019154449|nr:hypothetical protein [Natronorubrum halalkaliphilum]
MTFQLPTTCPICQETLAPDRSLDNHLVGSHTHHEIRNHTHRETASNAVSTQSLDD